MRRLSLSLLIALVALAIVEAVVVPLELLVPSEFRDRRATLFGLFEPHSDFGFRARPNLRNFEVTWRDGALTGVYSTDELGFRNVGRRYEESEIYFIGDSFTWGSWISREDTFPDRIGCKLGVSISNLGQESYYIEQYSKIARHVLKLGRPRKVAVCLFANDLTAPIGDEDLRQFYEKFQWNEYRSYPLHKKTFSYQITWFLGGLVGRFAVAFGWRLPPPPSHLDRRISPTGMELHRQLGVHPHYFSQSFNIVIETKLRTLLREIQARGSTPVVFLLPSKESAYKHVYTELFPGDYSALAMEEAGYSRLCGIAKECGVICGDLTSAFRKKSRSIDTYFRADPHWNLEGHRLAAVEMAPYLE